MLSLRTADIISTFLFFNITQNVEGVNLQSLLSNFTALSNQNAQSNKKWQKMFVIFMQLYHYVHGTLKFSQNTLLITVHIHYEGLLSYSIQVSD
jgi:hypothetical protein